MPRYVTESGYVEVDEARTLVGRNPPLPHTLWLVDIAAAKASKLSFDALPGIGADPLAALRKAAGKDALKGNRDVRIETDGDGSGPAIHWSDDSRNVAVLVRAVDNKDRWIATVDTSKATLQSRHHLHDDAWINWNFNDFGWLADRAHALVPVRAVRLFAAVSRRRQAAPADVRPLGSLATAAVRRWPSAPASSATARGPATTRCARPTWPVAPCAN